MTTNSPRPPLPKGDDYSYVRSLVVLAMANRHPIDDVSYLAAACCAQIASRGRLPDSDEARALSRLSRRRTCEHVHCSAPAHGSSDLCADCDASPMGSPDGSFCGGCNGK